MYSKLAALARKARIDAFWLSCRPSLEKWPDWLTPQSSWSWRKSLVTTAIGSWMKGMDGKRVEFHLAKPSAQNSHAPTSRDSTAYVKCSSVEHKHNPSQSNCLLKRTCLKLCRLCTAVTNWNIIHSFSIVVSIGTPRRRSDKFIEIFGRIKAAKSLSLTSFV